MTKNDAENQTALMPSVRDSLARHGIRHKVLPCSDEFSDTAAFCEHYNVSLDQAANTIVVTSRKVEPSRQAVCVVLGTTRLDVNKTVRELLGVKRASFADAELTVAVTGMVIGGVTPFGTAGVPIYVDSAVLEESEVIMGGGNRTSKLRLDPRELVKLPGVQVIVGLANPSATPAVPVASP